MRTEYIYVIALNDLNDKVGCMREAGVMAKFGMKGVYNNERKLLNMCRDTSMLLCCVYIVHDIMGIMGSIC